MPIKILNDYFGFNRQQRNGVAVLAAICLLLFLLRLSYPYFMDESTVQVLMLPADPLTARDSAASQATYTQDAVPSRLFYFDPNTVTVAELCQLGLDAKTATRLEKFRKKGFRFKKAEDLKKVYGLPESLVARLVPYVRMPQDIHQPGGHPTETSPSRLAVVQKKQVNKVDINAADSSMLVEVNGIGPAFARRIIKYRDMLGGYHSLEQLREVYGLTAEVYERIAPSLSLTKTELKKLDLNKDDFKTINRHPYIGYELTKKIFDWRRKTTISSANICDIIGDQALCARLLPYLAFP